MHSTPSPLLMTPECSGGFSSAVRPKIRHCVVETNLTRPPDLTRPPKNHSKGTIHPDKV